jgi:uncharacterized RmlC-like cupin family protein
MVNKTPKPTCIVISPGQTYEGKQGLTYDQGIFAENTGAQAICMHLLTIPPGGRAKGHLHAGHETAIYILSGEAGVWHGENLNERLVVKAGEYLYIPAGVPHLPYNLSETEPCIAVLARTDPNEQESVILVEIDNDRQAGAVRN